MYLIIETWNGTGYTESGTIDTANNEHEAKTKIMREFNDRYLCCFDDINISWEDDLLITFDVGDNQGSLRAIEINDNDQYLFINTDINDVEVMQTDWRGVIMHAKENGGSDMEKLQEQLLGRGVASIELYEGHFIIEAI